jgi:hypothetical protein
VPAACADIVEDDRLDMNGIRRRFHHHDHLRRSAASRPVSVSNEVDLAPSDEIARGSSDGARHRPAAEARHDDAATRDDATQQPRTTQRNNPGRRNATTQDDATQQPGTRTPRTTTRNDAGRNRDQQPGRPTSPLPVQPDDRGRRLVEGHGDADRGSSSTS